MSLVFEFGSGYMTCCAKETLENGAYPESWNVVVLWGLPLLLHLLPLKQVGAIAYGMMRR